jgi:hypothetical protein
MSSALHDLISPSLRASFRLKPALRTQILALDAHWGHGPAAILGAPASLPASFRNNTATRRQGCRRYQFPVHDWEIGCFLSLHAIVARSKKSV